MVSKLHLNIDTCSCDPVKWYHKGRINKKAMFLLNLHDKTSKSKTFALLNKQRKYLHLLSAHDQLVKSGNEFKT